MCRSMVDIQSAAAEIRREKRRGKKKKKKEDQNIMSASATQGGHNYSQKKREKKKISHGQQGPLLGSLSPFFALNQRGLNTIKLSYDR